MRSPSGTAMAAAIRNPVRIRNVLQATSSRKCWCCTMSIQFLPTRGRLGRKRGLLMRTDPTLQSVMMTTKLPMPSTNLAGRGIACLGVRRRRRLLLECGAGAALEQKPPAPPDAQAGDSTAGQISAWHWQLRRHHYALERRIGPHQQSPLPAEPATCRQKLDRHGAAPAFPRRCRLEHIPDPYRIPDRSRHGGAAWASHGLVRGSAFVLSATDQRDPLHARVGLHRSADRARGHWRGGEADAYLDRRFLPARVDGDGHRPPGPGRDAQRRIHAGGLALEGLLQGVPACHLPRSRGRAAHHDRLGLDLPDRRGTSSGRPRDRHLHPDLRAVSTDGSHHRRHHHHRDPRTDHGHDLWTDPSMGVPLCRKGPRVSEIRFLDVSMNYRTRRGEVRALQQISLTVPDGQFACIVGPSGCGKSTLLSVAAGLVIPTEGDVLVGGKPAYSPGADRGMVFQSYSLYPWLSVRRNIEFGLEVKRTPKTERARQSSELIHLMKLDGFADAYPKALSGGMKQRVAIARALANDPQVLLMDEPFGALDALTRQIMQEMLTDLWQRYRKTVLFVTHDIDEALFLGDVIYIMTNRPGRIRTTLSVDLPRPRNFEMVSSPRFTELRNQVVGIIHEESMKAVESELARA